MKMEEAILPLLFVNKKVAGLLIVFNIYQESCVEFIKVTFLDNLNINI